MTRALLVELAGEALAIPADGVRCEVIEAGATTGLPVAAPLLLGLSVIHGRAVPVVNVALLLGTPELGTAALHVLTEVQGEGVALPADRTLGLTRLPDMAESASPLSAPVTVPSPDGVGKLTVRAVNAAAMVAVVRAHLERV